MAAHHESERDAARSRVAEANREVARLEQQIQVGPGLRDCMIVWSSRWSGLEQQAQLGQGRCFHRLTEQVSTRISSTFFSCSSCRRQDLDGRRAALSAQLEELERAAASVEPRQAQLRMLQEQNKERQQRFAVGRGEGKGGATAEGDVHPAIQPGPLRACLLKRTGKVGRGLRF